MTRRLNIVLALILGNLFASCAFLKEATAYHPPEEAPGPAITYELNDSEVADAATIKMSEVDDKDRSIRAVIESVDDIPLKAKKTYYRIPDETIKISPGERKLIVRVLIFRTGIKNFSLLRFKLEARMQVDVRIEPRKEYRIRGAIREKSCVAWLEDVVSSAKITPEFIAPCVETGYKKDSDPAEPVFRAIFE